MRRSSREKRNKKESGGGLSTKGAVLLGIPLVFQLILVIVLFYLHDRAEAYAVRAANNKEFSNALSRYTTSAYASMYYIDDALWHHKQLDEVGTAQVQTFAKNGEDLKSSLHNRVLSDKVYGAIDSLNKQSTTNHLMDWFNQLEQRKQVDENLTPMEVDIAHRVDTMVAGVNDMVGLANAAAATAPDTDAHKQAFEKLQDQRHALADALKDEALMAMAKEETNNDFWIRDRERWLFYLLAGCGANILVVLAMGLYFRQSIVSRMGVIMENAELLANDRSLNPQLPGNDEIAQVDKSFHKLALQFENALMKQGLMSDYSHDVICYLDEQGTLLAINYACEPVIGYTPEEIEGSNLLNFLPDEEADSLLNKLQDIKHGNNQPFEMRLIRRDRRITNLLWAGAWLPMERTILCVVQDVTERKKDERFRQVVLQILGDDLRPSLENMQGFHKMLGKGQLGVLQESGRDLLRTADRNAERMMSLIDDLLDIDKLETGMLQLNILHVPLIGVFQKSLQRAAELASTKGVALDLQPTDLKVFCDEDRIAQVVTNLMEYAIRQTPPGRKVSLTTAMHPTMVEIRITDQGRGIPRHLLSTLFDHFGRGQVTDTQGQGGFGLELAISKALIELHGGNVFVTSDERTGTMFSIQLPNRQVAKDTADQVLQHDAR
jgi:PAS domain S-box-containing protein